MEPVDLVSCWDWWDGPPCCVHFVGAASTVLFLNQSPRAKVEQLDYLICFSGIQFAVELNLKLFFFF